MTIDLVSDSIHYYRFFGATGEPTTLPRVKQLFLSYYQDESRRSLRLDDRTVFFYGFERCGTFPRSVVGNSVKLSLTNDLIVVIYANEAGVRFAVGLGYYLGSAWTYIICDDSRLQTSASWESYAKEADDSIWGRQADLANNTSKYSDTTHRNPDTTVFIIHGHLPRSIWAARTTWGVWYRGNCTVTIDIMVCTGCCRGPLALETSTADWSGVETPGLMQHAADPSSPKYALYMDGTKMHLLHFTGIEGVQLGDYGRCDPIFKRDGNIFQYPAAADPAYDPVKRSISTGNDRTVAKNVTVRASGDNSSRLFLRRPEGLSLPNNRQLVLLLKALSCHLTDKCLVTSVVRATALSGHSRTQLCYLSQPQVWRRDTSDERREQFREIREQFYTLLNSSHPVTSAGNGRSPNSETVTKEAVKYFSAMFGIEHLENYVGRITFFTKLSTGELVPEAPEAVQDSSVNALVKTLRRRMNHRIHRQPMKVAQREIASISNTLGIKLLEEMAAVYTRAYHALRPLKGNMDRSCMEYDMSEPITKFISNLPPQTTTSRCDSIHTMVQDIKTRQTALDATENVDEQLALEEDITGKILWTCHSGLRPAVEHIPAKVLHSILAKDKMCNLVDRVKLSDWMHTRTKVVESQADQFLEEISRVFNDALAKLPTDDQAHLRRIMADAEAGTSKYQLLLDERAREQSSRR